LTHSTPCPQLDTVFRDPDTAAAGREAAFAAHLPSLPRDTPSRAGRANYRGDGIFGVLLYPYAGPICEHYLFEEMRVRAR